MLCHRTAGGGGSDPVPVGQDGRDVDPGIDKLTLWVERDIAWRGNDRD